MMRWILGEVCLIVLFCSKVSLKNNKTARVEELREMSRDSKEETVSKLEMQQWEEFDNYSTSEMHMCWGL